MPPTSSKTAKHRHRDDLVYYVVEIADWDWTFSFGVGGGGTSIAVLIRITGTSGSFN